MNDWAEMGQAGDVRLARELAAESRVGVTQVRARGMEGEAIRALERGEREHVEAMEAYVASPLSQEVERAGGVVLGVMMEEISGLALPVLVVSLWDGRVRMSVVRQPPGWVMTPGVRTSYGLNYSFATVFEDGSELLTWGRRTVMTPSSGRLTSLPGTGDFTTDFEAHCARVERAGADCYRVRELRDSVELTRYYYAHMIPEEMIKSIERTKLMNWLTGGVLFASVLWMIYRIVFGGLAQ